MKSPEAVVIGGGIAGSALATQLARAGRAVLAIERKAGAHHKVCGEFVSEEAALYLRDLGVDLEALGALKITGVRLLAGRRVALAPLPFPAFSLSRRILDEAILQAAAKSGADLRRGCAARSLRRHGDNWIVDLEDGGSVSAPHVFLATGKHDLRGWRRPPGRQADLVAFKMHWRLADRQIAELESVVELVLFPGGYAGLELVEDRIANLCLVVRRGHLASLGHRWDSLLAQLRSDCPLFDQRLTGATACWERPLAIASIPYGHVGTERGGPWRLGDQAAVIPSFAGGGMSLALHSARLATQFYLAGTGQARFQTRLAADVAAHIRHATVLSKLLVHPAGQMIGGAMAQHIPGLVGLVARYTRIPPRCVTSARGAVAAAHLSAG